MLTGGHFESLSNRGGTNQVSSSSIVSSTSRNKDRKIDAPNGIWVGIKARYHWHAIEGLQNLYNNDSKS